MVRVELMAKDGVREKFVGTVAAFGSKHGYKHPLPTILLTSVRSAHKKIVTDHLWFNLTKGFADLKLQVGDVVSFRARVKAYWKGYKGRDEYKQMEAPLEKDFHLSHPSNVEVVRRLPAARTKSMRSAKKKIPKTPAKPQPKALEKVKMNALWEGRNPEEHAKTKTAKNLDHWLG
jgi:hypothetical protein